MVGKKNSKLLIRRNASQQQHFTIKKLSIGVASILLGSTIFLANNNVSASTNDLQNQENKNNIQQVTTANDKMQSLQNSQAGLSASQTNENSQSAMNFKAGDKAVAPSDGQEVTSQQPSEEQQVQQPSKDPSTQINQGQQTNIQPKQLLTQSTATNTEATAAITDAKDYPQVPNTLVPADQYIFDQYTLTNGQVDSQNNYTALPLVITLSVNRTDPNDGLYCYFTSPDYQTVYYKPTTALPTNQTFTYENGRYSDALITITNYGADGVSVNAKNNNYGLAMTFGYGKYHSMLSSKYPSPFNANNVSNAWGDSTPRIITQTISYVNAQTGQEMPDVKPYQQSGLTGQHFEVTPDAQKVIQGYYLTNKEQTSGTISQFVNGGTYTYKWIDQAGNKIDEIWHQISNNGKMQVTVTINGKVVTDPNNPQGIVYPAGTTHNPAEPTQLVIDNGQYVFPNPYVPQTTNIVLKYAPLGKIVPVGPNGKPIPNAPTPTYTNDPNDPTEVTPNEPVPEIPGYTPEVTTVTPKDPGKDTTVIYTKNPEEVQGKVIYYDVTDHKVLSTADLKGTVGEKITYTTSETIKQYEDQGYKLVSSNFKNGEETYQASGNDYEVQLEHGTTTFNPQNPGKPGDPLNPNDPDGPKVTAEDVDYQKDVKSTVKYVGAGTHTPADQVQTAQWTRSITVDRVTGKIIQTTDWTPNKKDYQAVKTPVIAGYHADQAEVPSQTVTMDDVTHTVTYAPNGKIVPVGPNGEPIPNAPTPTYPTNPNNPTEVTPNEPVPEIPGYTPEVTTVTPKDPGKDTTVVYTKNPEEVQGKVTYYDVTDHKVLSTVDLKGTVGEKVTYTTSETIKQYEDQGYKLVSSNFKNGEETYQASGNDYEVRLEHGTTTFNPQNPGKPGDPLNPNDPDGPKVTTEDVNYQKDVKATVKYVGAGTHTPADQVQTAQWTRSITVDRVTGKIIQTTDWTPNKKDYQAVKTPVIAGYHADQAEVPSQTVTMDDVTHTVTYAPNGKIVPVGPNGEPIPNAPTPTYPTNPNNPTEVTPNEPVPEIPGYTPEVTTITPQNPGLDTIVKYVKAVVPDNVHTTGESHKENNISVKTPQENKEVTTNRVQGHQKAELRTSPNINASRVSANSSSQSTKATNATQSASQERLPQTGTSFNKLATIVGVGLAISASILALAGIRKDKQK